MDVGSRRKRGRVSAFLFDDDDDDDGKETCHISWWNEVWLDSQESKTLTTTGHVGFVPPRYDWLNHVERIEELVRVIFSIFAARQLPLFATGPLLKVCLSKNNGSFSPLD